MKSMEGRGVVWVWYKYVAGAGSLTGRLSCALEGHIRGLARSGELDRVETSSLCTSMYMRVSRRSLHQADRPMRPLLLFWPSTTAV